MKILEEGDEIRVAGGTYKPSSPSTSINLVSGVRIKGGYLGYNTQSLDPDARVETSVLSGDLEGDDDCDPEVDPGCDPLNDNARHVVKIPLGTQPPPNQTAPDFADRANLDGFEITAGYAYEGAQGGGIYVESDIQDSTRAIFRKCEIHNNKATSVGGGVYTSSGTELVFRQCDIHHNEGDEGGGVAASGDLTMLDCLIHDNTAAPGDGGGIKGLSGTPSNMTIVSCKIYNNLAYIDGGGLSVKSSGVTIKLINSSFIGNTAGIISGSGGAIDFDGGTEPNVLEMTNCTISGNTALLQAGGLNYGSFDSASFIKNSIFWDNTDEAGSPEIFDEFEDLTVMHTDVELPSGEYPGTGNINDNPDFVNAEDGDYRLSCGSPCLNTGSNSAVPLDSEDVDEDGDDFSATPDLDLLARLVGVVDRGAYEKQADPCAADIAPPASPDGIVNVLDLLAVISGWGNCGAPPAACPADIYPAPCGDGTVDVLDLLAIIGAWGMNCATLLYEDVGSLTSVTDCMDMCSSGYTPYSDDWDLCVDKCVDGLCQQEIIECE